MIRVVAIASLTVLLALVLYLPSAYPPAVFIEQVRNEHRLNRAFWGEQHAITTLARMLRMQESPLSVPLASPAKVNSTASSQMMAIQMNQVTGRLFGSEYFRSLDSLFTLGTYRLSTMVQMLPATGIFLAAALLDGLIRRVVKSKEFLQHNPEIFSACICLIIAAACGAAIALVYPRALHPVLLPAAMLIVTILSGIAIANYHRRA